MPNDLFCGHCGAPYGSRTDWPRTCTSCGTTAYRNPLPVAVALQPVRDENGTGLVVITRAIEPRKGLIALPGGFIDHGEDWQEAVVRELHEETGIQTAAKDVRLADAMSAPAGHLLLFGVLPGLRSTNSHRWSPPRRHRTAICCARPPNWPSHSTRPPYADGSWAATSEQPTVRGAAYRTESRPRTRTDRFGGPAPSPRISFTRTSPSTSRVVYRSTSARPQPSPLPDTTTPPPLRPAAGAHTSSSVAPSEPRTGNTDPPAPTPESGTAAHRPPPARAPRTHGPSPCRTNGPAAAAPSGGPHTRLQDRGHQQRVPQQERVLAVPQRPVLREAPPQRPDVGRPRQPGQLRQRDEVRAQPLPFQERGPGVLQDIRTELPRLPPARARSPNASGTAAGTPPAGTTADRARETASRRNRPRRIPSTAHRTARGPAPGTARHATPASPWPHRPTRCPPYRCIPAQPEREKRNGRSWGRSRRRPSYPARAMASAYTLWASR